MTIVKEILSWTAEILITLVIALHLYILSDCGPAWWGSPCQKHCKAEMRFW